MGIWAAKDCSACTQSLATTVEETVEGQEKEKRGIIDPSDIKKNYLAVAVLLILYNLYVMLLHHPWRLHGVFRLFQLILVMICLVLVSHYQRFVPISLFWFGCWSTLLFSLCGVFGFFFFSKYTLQSLLLDLLLILHLVVCLDSQLETGCWQKLPRHVVALLMSGALSLFFVPMFR